MKTHAKSRFGWVALALVLGVGCEDGADPLSSAATGGASGSGAGPVEGGSAGRLPDGAGAHPAGEAGQHAGEAGEAGQHTGEAGEAGQNGGEANDSGAGGQAGDRAGSAGQANAGGAGMEQSGVTLVPGVSERKWIRSTHGGNLVLEEELAGFASLTPPKTRVRRLTREFGTAAEWPAPEGEYISDFCEHPSGELSLVLRSSSFVFALVRLDPALNLLEEIPIHDPAVATDPHAPETGVTDLVANGLLNDAARICAVGEQAFAVTVSSLNAVIGYRAAFTAGSWREPQRTLIEPPVGLAPFLPIGGSFDTFGAIGEWFRVPLDVDEDGNAYVAVWAHPVRIRNHALVFQDGLTPLPADPKLPNAGDSDVLLTKLGPGGERLWTRVVGSEHEDEPYAIRAHGGLVAVAGRSRRFSGFDNTAWDALLSVTTATGDATHTVTMALDASSILLGVDARADGGFVVAGSDGWSQNPDGLSILSNGQQLLLEIPSLDAPPIRVDVASGPRHNELHAVIATKEGIAFAGHEDGPLTHSGDADATQIRATGVLGFVSR